MGHGARMQAGGFAGRGGPIGHLRRAAGSPRAGSCELHRRPANIRRLLALAMMTSRTSVTDPLAFWFLGARIMESTIHLISTRATAVTLRLFAFAVQMLIGLYRSWGCSARTRYVIRPASMLRPVPCPRFTPSQPHLSRTAHLKYSTSLVDLYQ